MSSNQINTLLTQVNNSDIVLEIQELDNQDMVFKIQKLDNQDIILECQESDNQDIVFESRELDNQYIKLDELQDIVNIRCMEIGEDKITLFNTECPICYDNVRNNNWVLFHPCCHIFCKECSLKITPMHNTVRKSCPICREPAKWINNLNDNIRQVSVIQSNIFNDDDDDLRFINPPVMMRQTSVGPSHRNFNNNVNYPPLGPVNRQTTIGLTYSNNNFMNNGGNIIERDSLVSQQPISDNLDIINQDIINCGYSKILHKEKNMGTLIISSNNNQNVSNGKDIVFVIDNSGSMDRTINNIKESIKNLIVNSTHRDRITVIFFDTEAIQLFPLQPMTSTIKVQVCDAIMAQHIGATTNFKSAFLLLKKVMIDGYIRDRQMIVIFGSDGIPDNDYEGRNEITELYNTDMIFQIYSCSFGGQVNANVLQSILKPDNQENYRHFAEISQFQYFVKNDLECDNSNIIAHNLKIVFKNVMPLSSLIIQMAELNKFEININILKSIDFLSFPLNFIDDDFEIAITYKNTNDEIVELNCSEINIDNNFTITTYNHKSVINIINNLNENTVLTNNLKIIEFETIKNTINIEDYGCYMAQIIDIINKSIEHLSVPIHRNHNNYNQIRQLTAQNTSCRSSSLGVVYPIEEKDDDVDEDVIIAPVVFGNGNM